MPKVINNEDLIQSDYWGLCAISMKKTPLNESNVTAISLLITSHLNRPMLGLPGMFQATMFLCS